MITPEQSVLAYRAMTVPLSFEDVGRLLRRSGERARHMYERASTASQRSRTRGAT